MLQVDGLRVEYGGVAAVHGVSFEISAGEIVGLIGANGAGKSSTLAAIFGLLKPASGSITFEGESLIGRKPEDVVRCGIALVPEGRQIFATLTVGENLRLGGLPRRDRGGQQADHDRLLDLFPIIRTAYDAPAGRLSGGEQQQLAIARALLSRPRLLLLDEPSLGLAPQMVDLVFKTIVSLRDEGMTVLLVEQNAVRTIALADRTYVFRTGQVAAVGDRETLAGGDDVAAMYLGD